MARQSHSQHEELELEYECLKHVDHSQMPNLDFPTMIERSIRSMAKTGKPECTKIENKEKLKRLILDNEQIFTESTNSEIIFAFKKF